jgi:hypothetical protein
MTRDVIIQTLWIMIDMICISLAAMTVYDVTKALNSWLKNRQKGKK